MLVNDLELIILTTKYKLQYLKMIEENSEDLKETGFYYRFPLSTEATFEEDIKVLDNRSKGIGLPEGKSPNSTFFLLNENNNEIVGAVNIRHMLDDYHRRRGGHIGYYVCQKERNKGYAKIILQKSLEICKQLGIDKVLLTCKKGNIASAKTILSKGGILEEEVELNDEILQRYWITL
jgi:predicted acetyltransferase